MIGCLRTRVRNQPIIALYFESENVLKLYNLEAWSHTFVEIDHEIISTSDFIWDFGKLPSAHLRKYIIKNGKYMKLGK